MACKNIEKIVNFGYSNNCIPFKFVLQGALYIKKMWIDDTR